MKLARMAVDRPVTMYMFYVAVILLGAVSLRELSVDLLPDISYPRLSVITNYPGVAPEEVETLITAPLESAVSRVPGLRRVESVSKEGVSLLTLEFDWGTDMDFTMLHTREQLDNAKDRFPEDAESPTIIPLDPQSRPIMTLALSGDRTLLELKELSEELIKPRLEQIEGVGSAEITGGVEREIQVEADPQKLALYGLTVEIVAARVDAFNRNLQGGTIRKGTFKYALRVVGEFESLDEIGEIGLLVTKEGGVVRLRDVATVIDSIKERQGITRLGGAESIGLLVRKESGANTVKVTKLVRETIGQIRTENPGITLSVVNEQAKTIEDAIGAVKDELIQGAVLAFLTLLIFLQEWKTPLIIGTVIPISIIGAFSLLFFGNITLNIMSLGGLALGVGMLDDCAVVVSENIFRHRSLGKSLKEAAYVGTKEVGPAVVSTALTTIVVFLPVIYVHGVAGQLFKDTALTVTFALLASLLVSLTLIATLESREFDFGIGKENRWRWRWDLGRIWKPAKPGSQGVGASPAGGGSGSPRPKRRLPAFLTAPVRAVRWFLYAVFKGLGFVLNFLVSFVVQLFALVGHYLGLPFRPLLKMVFSAFNVVYGRFITGYQRFLRWSLDHKGRVMAWTLVFFAVVFALGGLIRRELMPPMETTAFELDLKMPVDFSFEQTTEMAVMLESELRGLAPVKTVLSQIGIVSGMESADPNISVNSARFFVEVGKPKELEGVLEAARSRLADFPDIAYTVSRGQSTFNQFLALSAAEIGLQVKGKDLDRLKEIAADLTARLAAIPGVADVATNIGEGKPEFKVTVDKEALKKYPGLSPSTIGNFLVSAVRGRVATQFREMEKKYDILVRLEDTSRENIEALLGETLPFESRSVPLRDLVSYEVVRGPREIRRENQQREVLVTANLKGRKISQVTPAIDKAISAVRLPTDYRITWSGEREEMSRSFQSLILALLLAALLTYMIMAAQFESLIHPFIVMFTLPMGAAGAIVALLLTGQTYNVISIIGMVVLVGIVVDNATVKIDYTNQLRRGGMPLREAVEEGSHVRLRPILMSTGSTLVGLIPMALALERGAELMQPLAIVVIGGLTFSTFMTLILIPVIYEWVESRKG
ncbi:MAG: efflux RND transporter permease subunit [Candidatus Aminicenantales bacterium]